MQNHNISNELLSNPLDLVLILAAVLVVCLVAYQVAKFIRNNAGLIAMLSCLGIAAGILVATIDPVTGLSIIGAGVALIIVSAFNYRKQVNS